MVNFLEFVEINTKMNDTEIKDCRYFHKQNTMNLCLDKKILSKTDTKENKIELPKDVTNSQEENSSYFKPNKKIKLNKCKGCYPIFQPNQEGHIGEYGCLGNNYDLCVPRYK